MSCVAFLSWDNHVTVSLQHAASAHARVAADSRCRRQDADAAGIWRALRDAASSRDQTAAERRARCEPGLGSTLVDQLGHQVTPSENEQNEVGK